MGPPGTTWTDTLARGTPAPEHTWDVKRQGVTHLLRVWPAIAAHPVKSRDSLIAGEVVQQAGVLYDGERTPWATNINRRRS